jgi:ribonuclease HI
VVAYADGSCEPNPGKGGWGVVLILAGGARSYHRGRAVGRTTNNKMELEAVRQAILLGAREIYTDSLYVVRALMPSSRIQKNVAIIGVVRALVTLNKVSVAWVSSRAKYPDHVIADRLSKEGRLYG